MTKHESRNRKPSRSLVEIHFYDGSPVEYLQGIHQILMLGDDHLILTHGTRTESLTYDTVKEIIVRFEQ